MVKRANKTVAVELDKLNETDTSAILDYTSQLLSTRNQKSKDNSQPDDLIVSLSDAYENKRARQVFEWELVRRQNLQRAT